jgi:hypothetical protein
VDPRVPPTRRGARRFPISRNGTGAHAVKRSMAVRTKAGLALLVVLGSLSYFGCAGHDADPVVPPASPADAGIATTHTDPPAATVDAAPAATTPPDSGPDQAAPSALSTCVMRLDAADGGAAGSPCHGSAECPIGMLCCAAAGATTGAVGTCGTTTCSGAQPTQLCSANCECAVGTCHNAWPYIVFATCE